MPRKRRVSFEELQMSARDVFLRLGTDPLPELLNYAMEKVPDANGNQVALAIAMVGWQKGLPLVIDILKFANELVRPKLRSAETHGTQEHIYNITIRQFGPASDNPVVLTMREPERIAPTPDDATEHHDPV